VHPSHEHHRVSRATTIHHHLSLDLVFYRIDARTHRLDETPVVVVVVGPVDDIILVDAMLALVRPFVRLPCGSSRTVDDGRRSTRGAHTNSRAHDRRASCG